MLSCISTFFEAAGLGISLNIESIILSWSAVILGLKAFLSAMNSLTSLLWSNEVEACAS